MQVSVSANTSPALQIDTKRPGGVLDGRRRPVGRSRGRLATEAQGGAGGSGILAAGAETPGIAQRGFVLVPAEAAQHRSGYTRRSSRPL